MSQAYETSIKIDSMSPSPDSYFEPSAETYVSELEGFSKEELVAFARELEATLGPIMDAHANTVVHCERLGGVEITLGQAVNTIWPISDKGAMVREGLSSVVAEVQGMLANRPIQETQPEEEDSVEEQAEAEVEESMVHVDELQDENEAKTPESEAASTNTEVSAQPEQSTSPPEQTTEAVVPTVTSEVAKPVDTIPNEVDPPSQSNVKTEALTPPKGKPEISNINAEPKPKPLAVKNVKTEPKPAVQKSVAKEGVQVLTREQPKEETSGFTKEPEAKSLETVFEAEEAFIPTLVSEVKQEINQTPIIETEPLVEPTQMEAPEAVDEVIPQTELIEEATTVESDETVPIIDTLDLLEPDTPLSLETAGFTEDGEVVVERLEDNEREFPESFVYFGTTPWEAKLDNAEPADEILVRLSEEGIVLPTQVEISAAGGGDTPMLPIEEVEVFLTDVAEVLNASESQLAEAAKEIVNKIVEVVTKLEVKEQAIESEVEEELKELFIELFEQLGINSTPELVESLTRFIVGRDLSEVAKKLLDQEDGLQDVGTHEFIKQLLLSAGTLKKAMANAYVIGKSTLRLYRFKLAFEKSV